MRRRSRYAEIAADPDAPRLSHSDFIGDWIKMLGPAADRLGVRPNPKDADYVERLEFESVRQTLRNLRSFPMIQVLEHHRHLRLHGALFRIMDGRLFLLDESTGVFNPVCENLRHSQRATAGASADQPHSVHRRPGDIAGGYDAILCDSWGVLIDGQRRFRKPLRLCALPRARRDCRADHQRLAPGRRSAPPTPRPRRSAGLFRRSPLGGGACAARDRRARRTGGLPPGPRTRRRSVSGGRAASRPIMRVRPQAAITSSAPAS
jgi:hypothetical protein